MRKPCGEVLESLKAHPEFDRRHAALRALLLLVPPYAPAIQPWSGTLTYVGGCAHHTATGRSAILIP